MTADYTLNDDNSIKVLNSQFDTKANKRTSAEARATCVGAACEVSFNIFAKGDYRVISTDYVNYAIVFSCRKFLWWKIQNLWILGREQTLTEAQMTVIKRIVAE